MAEYNLAYQLMVDRYVSDDLFAKMIKMAKVSGIYFLEIYIELIPKQEYDIQDVEFRLMDDRYEFVLNYYASDPDFESRWKHTFNIRMPKYLDKFAAMVRKSTASKSRYFFIPLVIDYGLNSRIVHQGAIIFDQIEKRSILYEPYGMYEKMNKDYSSIIMKLLRVCFPDFAPTTYHKLLQIPIGIQTIILMKNNARVNDYNKKMDELRQLLSDKGIKVPERKDDTLNNDKTVTILDYMDHLEHINNPEIAKHVMQIYADFTSKTCVTLTLIELYTFFTRHDVKDLYQKIDVEFPNPVVFEQLKNIFMKAE